MKQQLHVDETAIPNGRRNGAQRFLLKVAAYCLPEPIEYRAPRRLPEREGDSGKFGELC
jgi:hypothetical protein